MSDKRPETSSFFSWLDLLYLNRLLFLSVVAITMFATTIFLLVTPVWYRVETVLMPVSGSSSGLSGALSRAGAASFGNLADLGGLIGDSGSENAGLAMLQSRGLVVQLIRKDNLLPILFASKWDAENHRWNSDDPARAPTMDDGVKLFNTEIRTVVQDLRTRMITLTVEWKDPILAARWSRELADQVNLTLRARASNEADDSLKYLDSQLRQTTDVDLRTSIINIIQAQQEKKMDAVVRKDYALKFIDPPYIPADNYYVWPKKGFTLVVAFMAAIALAILIVQIKTVAVNYLHARRWS